MEFIAIQCQKQTAEIIQELTDSSPYQVFAYRYIQQGAVAIVKSKATGKTLIIACSAPEYGVFREQVFKEFLGTTRDF